MSTTDYSYQCYFETESSMNFFKFSSCVSCLEISCARDIMGSLGVELTSHKDIFINCVNRYLPLPLVDWWILLYVMLKLWTLYILRLITVWKSHKVSLLPTPASPDLMSDVYVIYPGTAAAAWPHSAHTGNGSDWRLSATWADEQIKL